MRRCINFTSDAIAGASGTLIVFISDDGECMLRVDSSNVALFTADELREMCNELLRITE